MALNSHSHEDVPKDAAPTDAAPKDAAPKEGAPKEGEAAAPGAAAAKGASLNNTAHDTTNVLGAMTTKDVIVDKRPYDVKRCDNVIMLDAKRIPDFDDFTSRSPAFFTMSAYLINMFESKDNNKLMESIALAHIRQLPVLLKGSKDCMIFSDGVNRRNITMCVPDAGAFEEIEKAYSDFMTCRMGGDLNAFDPATINSVLTASCNGFNSTEGVHYDLPAIRSQVSNELSKAGFLVTDTTVSGAAGFGLNSDTSKPVGSAAASAKKIDYRVPGTF